MFHLVLNLIQNVCAAMVTRMVLHQHAGCPDIAAVTSK